MKKFIFLLIALLLLIGIAGCQQAAQIKEQDPIASNESSEVQIEDSDEEAAAEKQAIDLVIENFHLTYNVDTEDYSQEGKSYTVVLLAYGFDDYGRYEIRICPSYYPLSVFTYCYVDLENGTVYSEP